MNKWLFIFLIGSNLTVMAQESAVKFPRGNAAWTVTISKRTPVADDGTSLRIVRVAVSRAGNYRRDKVDWSDGTATENWWTARPLLFFYADPRTGETALLQPDDTYYSFKLDESAFHWLKSARMKGEETLNGIPCIVWEGEQLFAGGEDGKVKMQAWIDRDTGLPVALESNNERFCFQFQEPPTADLAPPALVRERLELVARVHELPPAPRKRTGRN